MLVKKADVKAKDERPRGRSQRTRQSMTWALEESALVLEEESVEDMARTQAHGSLLTRLQELHAEAEGRITHTVREDVVPMACNFTKIVRKDVDDPYTVKLCRRCWDNLL